MVNYKCPRCGYNSDIKTLYVRHLQRKYMCKNILINDKLQNEYIKYDILEKINNNTNSAIQMNNNNVNNIYNANEMSNCNYTSKKTQKNEANLKKTQKIVEIPQNINLKCNFCNKLYSRQDNLNRHYKSCKEKNKIDEANNSMNELVKILNEQIKEQKEQLEKRDKQINELIKKAGIQNSTITNNIQNNIKLLAYKDTDISKISDKDIMKCINHSNMCVPHLIKMIHLDPKKPENHNIYISNLKNGYIMMYDGNKWNTLNRDDIITDMIDDKQNIIEEKIEDWVTKGKEYPELMKKFERYLDKRDNNEILNKIKDEIKLMLYNNRNLIIDKLED